MSILFDDCMDGFTKLFIKGADSIIFDRLSDSQYNLMMKKKTEKYLTECSIKGYRTLVMAMKLVSEEELEEFKNQLT